MEDFSPVPHTIQLQRCIEFYFIYICKFISLFLYFFISFAFYLSKYIFFLLIQRPHSLRQTSCYQLFLVLNFPTIVKSIFTPLISLQAFKFSKSPTSRIPFHLYFKKYSMLRHSQPWNYLSHS